MIHRNEAGYATILVLGMTMIAIAVAGLAVDGTRAFLFRRSLQNAADAAALAGAAEVDRARYYSSGGRSMSLDERAAEERAVEWLRLRSLPASSAVDANERVVRVVVQGDVSTTFLRVIGIRTLPVEARSVARPLGGGV